MGALGLAWVSGCLDLLLWLNSFLHFLPQLEWTTASSFCLSLRSFLSHFALNTALTFAWSWVNCCHKLLLQGELMAPEGSASAWMTCYPNLLPSVSATYYKPTHRAEIPQCPPDFFPAWMKSNSPIRLMVGMIVNGPMNFSTNPTSPESPSMTWSNDATRIAPWI